MLHLRDIMTTDVATLAPDATLREAVAFLAGRHISGAPVVSNEAVLGVVTTTDVLDFLAAGRRDDDGEPDQPESTFERQPWDDESEPPARFFTELWDEVAGTAVADDEATPHHHLDPLAEHTVEEVMTPRVLSLPSTVDVAAAADFMRIADVHRVLVTDQGRLVGIVTTTDITRAVADGRIVRRIWSFDSVAPKSPIGNRGRYFGA